VVPRLGSFQDALLDALAVVKPSRSVGLHEGASALRAGGGPIIAVLGAMSEEEAIELAATRSGAPATALVLGSGPRAAQILANAGWRAVAVTADTPLAVAWQQLQRTPGTVRT
jgi:hypothetical protein